MASRLRDAGLGTTRIVEILRLQWARPGRQATDVLLKDFAGIAPGWDEWLVEQGAIARLARATLSLPDTLSFVSRSATDTRRPRASSRVTASSRAVDSVSRSGTIRATGS